MFDKTHEIEIGNIYQSAVTGGIFLILAHHSKPDFFRIQWIFYKGLRDAYFQNMMHRKYILKFFKIVN